MGFFSHQKNRLCLALMLSYADIGDSLSGGVYGKRIISAVSGSVG